MIKILSIVILYFFTSSGDGFEITSSAFEPNGDIPSKYTCEGKNINPPLRILNPPAGTISYALIMSDPDATNGTFDHWVVWNIPVGQELTESSTIGTIGSNSARSVGYRGPCPPDGAHRYFFTVYALDTILKLKKGSNREALEDAMKDHILGKAELIGIFEKEKKE